MNPCGYYLISRMVASYIDYLVRHDTNAFQEAAYVRTPYAFDETGKERT